MHGMNIFIRIQPQLGRGGFIACCSFAKEQKTLTSTAAALQALRGQIQGRNGTKKLYLL